MKVLETERLVLRWLDEDDAAFILRLVNEPSWLRYIGDRGVRTLEDARNFLQKGPLEMYARLGFGLYHVGLKEGGASVGMCGLLKRETLADVDIGFAFLPEYQGKGYAFESASAVVSYGTHTLGLSRLAAVISPDNDASARLLEKLGFRFERFTQIATGAPEVKLYVTGRGASRSDQPDDLRSPGEAAPRKAVVGAQRGQDPGGR